MAATLAANQYHMNSTLFSFLWFFVWKGGRRDKLTLYTKGLSMARLLIFHQASLLRLHYFDLIDPHSTGNARRRPATASLLKSPLACLFKLNRRLPPP